MLRWLWTFCANLVRKADAGEGAGLALVTCTSARLAEAGILPIEPAAPAMTRRAGAARFMLSARIASSQSLNPPVARPKKPTPRISSTKPLPKPVAIRAKVASQRRQVLIPVARPQPEKAGSAEIVRLVPKAAKPAARMVRLAKAA